MNHRSPPSLGTTAGRALALWLAVAAPPAFAQTQVTTRAMDLEFSGRLQFQLQTSSCTDATPPVSSPCVEEAPALDMFLRRARISVEATIDDRLSLKLEPDFSDVDEVSLKDAWGRYAFAERVAVRAGHFKRPFDGFHLTSSSHLPFEREVRIPGVPRDAVPSYTGLTRSAGLSDRDIGFMLEGTGAEGRFAWWLGAFTGGSASNAEDTNDGKQFVGRMRVALAGGETPVHLAGAIALTDLPYVATDGETETEPYTNFELFAERGAWDRDGLLVQAGVVAGENPRLNEAGLPPDLAANDELASLLAWQAVAAYRIPATAAWLDAVTPFFRLTRGDPSDAEDDEVVGLTPGVALFFHGRNRLALTWDVASPAAEGVDSESSFTAQMQFHF